MDPDAVRRLAATFVTDTTDPAPPRHRRLRRGRYDLVEAADVIIAFICFLVSNTWLSNQSYAHHHGHNAGAAFLIALVTSAPLILRTRFPLTAWVASALAIIGSSVAFPLHSVTSGAYVPGCLPVYGLCLYSVTVRCKPRIVVAVALATMTGAAFINWQSAPAAFFLSAIPLLIGVVVRMRRSSRQQLAEQELRHSGERALLEERQRIARELHDVVAHHMSVIAIAAEAAPYKAADPPEELVECFGEIRASALTGLAELRRAYREWPLLGTLLDNAEMSLAKTDRAIAARYLALGGRDDLTALVLAEYDLTRRLLLEVTGHERLLANRPVLSRAVTLRDP